ncbi:MULTISPECIES: helix-turn-helix domain-containing protein [unclassified Arthrobacter]|uniref:helix-turn-helix domain-containing protein n=1 Tax=unclassified Arthrobacter TaxID=235627 RepID=UPI0033072D2A
MWRVRGDTELVTKPDKRQFSLDFKLNAVQKYLAGEDRGALAKELGLSSPHLLTVWTGKCRAEGEEGLRPKRKEGHGRPWRSPGRNRSWSVCAAKTSGCGPRWLSWEK